MYSHNADFSRWKQIDPKISDIYFCMMTGGKMKKVTLIATVVLTFSIFSSAYGFTFFGLAFDKPYKCEKVVERNGELTLCEEIKLQGFPGYYYDLSVAGLINNNLALFRFNFDPSEYQNVYRAMREKYGKPHSQSANETIWYRENNRITLEKKTPTSTSLVFSRIQIESANLLKREEMVKKEKTKSLKDNF
jgi:hypothetical protein